MAAHVTLPVEAVFKSGHKEEQKKNWETGRKIGANFIHPATLHVTVSMQDLFSMDWLLLVDDPFKVAPM